MSTTLTPADLDKWRKIRAGSPVSMKRSELDGLLDRTADAIRSDRTQSSAPAQPTAAADDALYALAWGPDDGLTAAQPAADSAEAIAALAWGVDD